MANIKSILDILLFIGAAQGLLLSTALFSLKRGNTAANRILAVLLFSFSILIFFHAAGHYHEHPPTLGRHRWMIHAFLFIIAPLLFFYTRALTRYRFRMRWKDAIHFLPSIGAMIAALLLEDIFHVETSSISIDRIFLAVMAVQMVIYLIRMLFILRDHTKNIQNTYSSMERINLRWLRIFVISQTMIWPVAGFIDMHKHDSSEVVFVWLLVSIFMYITGYFAIRQPEIFSGELQEDQLPLQSGKKKYEKSAISPEQAELILHRLQTFMETSKPYLIPTLTLPALSKQMNVSPHHLSQIINEKLNNNFFEFINRFRVNEAKRLLKDPQKQHLTLAGIGYEAGFNSVSSFNSVFKKVTSFTPSEYRLSDERSS
jgi:AraC-like DNA-binding protein